MAQAPIILNPGVGGDSIWADSNTGDAAKIPGAKLVLGAIGNDDGPISKTNALPVAPIGAFRSSFRYSGIAQAIAATPSDYLLIKGSASKTVLVREIRLGGLATTAGSMPVQLIRRSADNTTGTRAAVTAGAQDGSDATAATAVVYLYSANAGGLGAAAGGPLGSARIWLPLATGAPTLLTWTFGNKFEKSPILSGVSDFIAINFGGAAVPAGGVIDFEIHTEEF